MTSHEFFNEFAIEAVQSRIPMPWIEAELIVKSLRAGGSLTAWGTVPDKDVRRAEHLVL